VDITTPIWRKPGVMGYCLPPMLWGLAVLGMSGNVGSATNTRNLLHWLLSWFVTLKPAQIDLINFYLRKTGHVLAYGLMYFLWFRAFRGHADYGPGRACLWSLGCCLLYASMDEGRQWFFPSRGASIRDVLLDMSGASLAALITAAVWRPRDLAAPIPLVIWWRQPHWLYYWSLPVLWSLAVLAVLRGLVPVETTLGPLRWFVSWFAVVDSYDLKILNLYLWKAGQAMAFGILYVLWFRAFQGDAGIRRGRSCLYAIGLCLLVAVMHEGLQTFSRTPEGIIYDVILDLSGVSLSALVIAALWRPRYHALARAGIEGRQTRSPE